MIGNPGITILQNYEIDMDIIADLATLNGYWEGVHKFLEGVGKDLMDTNQLTIKQVNWLEKIAEDAPKQHKKHYG